MSDFCESFQIHIPLNIQGLQKLTLLDCPGKAAAMAEKFHDLP